MFGVLSYSLSLLKSVLCLDIKESDEARASREQDLERILFTRKLGQKSDEGCGIGEGYKMFFTLALTNYLLKTVLSLIIPRGRAKLHWSSARIILY